MKKILSLMITLAMITTMLVTVSFPVSAAWQDTITAAQPQAYTGSEGEGYLITTPAEFMWLNGKNVTAYLGADIQIGEAANPFTAPFSYVGKLIGTNANDLYTITAYISKAEENIGLFKSLTGATIKNIEIAGAITSSNNDYVGALAGRVSNIRIENVVNRAAVSGKQFVGGIVGRIGASEGTVDNSIIINAKNYGSIQGSSNYSAGIVGWYISGKIINSANFGTVTGNGSYSAGLVARFDGGTIYNSYNAGNITSKSYIGGLAGVPINYNKNDNPAILNSFNVGNVTATSGGAGGIMGHIFGGVTKVYGCYNAGEVSATGNKCVIEPNKSVGKGDKIDLKDNRYIVNSTVYTSDNGATKYESVTVADVASWSISEDVSALLLEGYPLSGWAKTSVKYPQLTTNMFPADYNAPVEEEKYVGEYGEGLVIDSAEDFLALNSNRNAVAYLTSDIQLGTPEAPITSPITYNGKLIGTKEDGNYKITAYVNTSANYSGIFVSLGTGAVVKNIDIYGSITAAGEHIGGLAGALQGGQVINVNNYASVTGNQQVGGLFGKVENVGTAISVVANCANYGTISSTVRDYPGGIVGAFVGGNVINSANYGAITSKGGYAGGIAGYTGANAVIYNSFNAGDVKAGYFAGGIAGLANASGATIANSFNAGKVETTGNYDNYSVSGILGTSSTNTAYIYGCYNVGTLSCLKGGKFAITGNNFNNQTSTTVVQDCRYIGEQTYTGTNGATGYVEVTADDLKSWKITADLSSKINASYPISDWTIEGAYQYPQLVSNPYVIKQDGTAAAPYLIASKDDFMKIKDNNTAYYKLVKDIDLGSYEPFEFKGSLTADTMKTITVDINLPEKDNVGLFSHVNNAVAINNIRIAGKVVGKSNVGGLAGYLTQNPTAAIPNGIITNCENTAEVTAMNTYAGGIAGYLKLDNANYEVTIVADCVNKGNVTIHENGSYGAGGILGINFTNKSSIDRCINYGNVSGKSQTAGIVGYNGGNLRFSANFGEISGTSRVAGLVAHQAGRGVIDCYNAGTIRGKSDSVAGVVGYGTSLITINCCYNSGNIYNYYDTYASGTILGTAAGAYSHKMQYTYNVGTVYNHYDVTPVNALIGRYETDAVPAVTIDAYTFSVGTEDSAAAYTKTPASLKTYKPHGVNFVDSTTDYPYAQLKNVKVLNDKAFELYTATVNVTGEGDVSIKNGSLLSNADEMLVILNPAEGGSVESIKINNVSYEANPIYNDDEEIIYYDVIVEDVNADVTIDIVFKSVTVTDSETIQAKVNTYEVTYFRPIILQNEIINKGTENEIELVRGTNYAIIMSQAESFEGYELVDFGVKNEDNYLTAKPYITEDGEFGTLLYGNKIYSGNKLTFKPYIKLKNVVTGEETYFEGNAAEITIR